MITYNLKTFLTVFALGLLIGFSCTLFLNGCGESNPSPAITIIPPKDIKKQADDSAEQFKEKIAALQEKTMSLEAELKTTKEQLAQVKQRTTKREAAIKQLVEPKGFPARKLVEKSNQPVSCDSCLFLLDTLKKEVTEYLNDNVVKDSLYQLQADQLDSTIAVKDTIIAAQIKENEAVKQLLNQSLQQQELLLGNIRQMKKNVRRQKVRSTIKTIGLMILSGAATRFINR